MIKRLLRVLFILIIRLLAAFPFLHRKVRGFVARYTSLEISLLMLIGNQNPNGSGNKNSGSDQNGNWQRAFRAFQESPDPTSNDLPVVSSVKTPSFSKKVSIIVLTWNGLAYTRQCLDSLSRNTTFDNFEIIVVDNGSNRETIDYLESLDTITLIKNEKNIGFTRGNNIGIRFTKDTDIVLLNNDMNIIQKDWLGLLQQSAYQDDHTGIVGCRLVNEQNMLLHAGTFLYPETYWGQQIGSGQTEMNQYNVIREVEGVVFACVYIKREVIEKVGLLDEDFFAYFEDTDYCLKAKAKGYKTVCDGRVTLMHYQHVSTRENKLSFPRSFSKAQKTFRTKWPPRLLQQYQRKIAWHSIVNFPSGYAVSSKNIMLALDRKHVDVRYKYVYGKNTPFPVKEDKISENYIINILTGRPFDDLPIQVVYGQGDVFHKNTGRYKIGFTMLEVSGIPGTWVENANRMDEVWVPSHFNIETFRDSGVKVPIYTIPLGTDPDLFNPFIKSFRQTDKFTFLSVFEWGERKNPEKLLSSFSKEFQYDKDVQLVCKIINNDASIDIPDQIRRMELAPGHPEIVFIHNKPIVQDGNGIRLIHCHEIPDYEMGALYRSADCFVLPTHGEGWGMPILEAMACALPVIVTNWSAQTEFMNDKNAFLLRTKALIDAKAKCPYYDGFQWANPDEEHLQYLMRYVYEHREEAKAKGRYASEDVLKNWTWNNSADIIIKRLETINEGL